MQRKIFQLSMVFYLGVLYSHSVLGFNSPIRYSDQFYAAQKFFYQEAKSKYSKIKAEKAYPEVPIKGSAKEDDLSKIEALQDYFEARRVFLAEAEKYPEQIYPEVFSFLNNHPGLKVNASNKAKLAALEKYFSPFYSLFSADKHYAFHSELKQNPCPIVFCLSDAKKNSLSFKLYNTSKVNYEFNCVEFPNQSYLNVQGKKPIQFKAGGSVNIACIVDLVKLKSDSAFRIVNLVLSDPKHPRVKIIIPVVLLPSKSLLNLTSHLYDLNFNYSTFFKHISLQKEKSSWPEPCPNADCSGKINYSLRNKDQMFSTYSFGDLCKIQYNINTQASLHNLKTNIYTVRYHELGNLAGEARNCVDLKTGEEVHCAEDVPNNGKELYGSRKLEYKLFVMAGTTSDLDVQLNYSDLPNQVANSELSWLQEKVLVLVVNDKDNNQIHKQFILKNNFKTQLKNLGAGTYSIELFPVTEDGKLKPSFNIQHLNHGGFARFDYQLSATFTLTNHELPKIK